jgi:hypothetical protein
VWLLWILVADRRGGAAAEQPKTARLFAALGVAGLAALAKLTGLTLGCDCLTLLLAGANGRGAVSRAACDRRRIPRRLVLLAQLATLWRPTGLNDVAVTGGLVRPELLPEETALRRVPAPELAATVFCLAGFYRLDHDHGLIVAKCGTK